MRHFALIGYPLGHSYSKTLFDGQHFADADYRIAPMPDLMWLRHWVRVENIAGFNVTHPFKQSVLPLLDALSPEAEAIGAVNCVAVNGQRMTGHNTDAPAFRSTLQGLGPWTKALVLGTGGAARAVMHALRQQGTECTMVSRHPDKHPGALGYSDAADVMKNAESTLLVNATPVGTWPDSRRSPWPWPETLTERCTVYDLTYNPSPTLLMQQALQQGASVKDGLAMLRIQARLSWRLWSLEQP